MRHLDSTSRITPSSLIVVAPSISPESSNVPSGLAATVYCRNIAERSTIVFAPSAIDAVTSPTVGPDGFPNDEFFYDSGVPFMMTSAQGTMSGTLRMRHLVPSP